MIPSKDKFYRIVYLDDPSYNYVGYGRFTGKMVIADPLEESNEALYEFDSLDGAHGFTDKALFAEAHIVSDACNEESSGDYSI